MPIDNILLPGDGQTVATREESDVHTQRVIVDAEPAETSSHATVDHINAQAAGTFYALIGVRAKATEPDLVVDPAQATVMVQTNDDFEWIFVIDPVVAGTFAYTDLAGRRTQIATGDSTNNPSTNTVTGGTIVARGFGSKQTAISAPLETAVPLGQLNQVVLAARGLGGNADFHGSLIWRELLP